LTAVSASSATNLGAPADVRLTAAPVNGEDRAMGAQRHRGLGDLADVVALGLVALDDSLPQLGAVDGDA